MLSLIFTSVTYKNSNAFSCPHPKIPSFNGIVKVYNEIKKTENTHGKNSEPMPQVNPRQ